MGLIEGAKVGKFDGDIVGFKEGTLVGSFDRNVVGENVVRHSLHPIQLTHSHLVSHEFVFVRHHHLQGSSIGSSVGRCVGTKLGTAVGSSDGDCVGTKVGICSG